MPHVSHTSPAQRVVTNTALRLPCHVLLVMVALTSFCGTDLVLAQALRVSDVEEASLPPDVAPPGDVQHALRFVDSSGDENLVLLSTVTSEPHEDANARGQWDVVVHLRWVVGGSRQTLVSERRHFHCGEAFSVEVQRPRLSDVDGDGEVELRLNVAERCRGTQRMTRLGWEGQEDLLPRAMGGYGGNATLPSSLRGHGLRQGITRRWRSAMTKMNNGDSLEATRSITHARNRSGLRSRVVADGRRETKDLINYRDSSGHYSLRVQEARWRVGDIERWTLAARLFRRQSGRWELVRQVRARDSCEGDDLVARYIPSSVHLSDWNGDGVRELSFLHTAGCMTDYSPADATLVVLEGGSLHQVRGTTFTGDPGAPPYSPNFRWADDPMLALLTELRD